ncbi:zinc finger protein ZAT9-like [Arachis stenosperma]|uniref:zinc finger protein ZAT9-like n=1 Tax=Arachis stenosperma TaxID=217475 RepID=UPI0025AD3E9E|nr:zinc finger protein ZAT9-like [Arachis stenosperma]
MERHRCKLCSRTFANGRALGGHMKAHLATLPLPPKPHQPPPQPQPLSFEYSSSSSSSSESEHDDDDDEEKGYGLRENPKRSFRVADPEFSFPAADDATVVVQDRESETESKNKPTRTRRRSNRTRKSSIINLTNKRTKLMSFMESPASIATEAAEPVSSVSDTSPEEDLAMCLIMLSRDKWRKTSVEEEEEMKLKNKKVLRGKHHHHHRLQCDKCGKTFRSSGALGSHRSICLCDEADGSERIFQCPYCSKVFGSGQALGGHKRSHLLPSSSSSSPPSIINANLRLKQQSFIDLNLPAPPEEDDLSVLSDA